MKKKMLRKWVRIAIFFAILAIFITSCNLIIKSIDWKTKNNKEVLYTYHIGQNLDYSVNLYKNNFIEDDHLGKNDTYIADLVKNIEASFNYNYSGTTIEPLTYNYSLTGTITGEYKLDEDNSNSKVWTKKYEFVKPTTKEIVDASQFNIKENLVIDFHKFDDEVSEFRKELKLSINAKLVVKMSITVTSKENQGKIYDTSEQVLTIPLNMQAFKINSEYNETKNQNIFVNEEIEELDYKKLTCGIISLICSIILIVSLYKIIFNIPPKTFYTIELNKILKEYGDIIIEVIDQVEKENYNIIIVKNFNEMVDLEEELRIPIMFYEIEENEKGEFTLIHNNILYQYVLENEKNPTI